jgi:hypothetical protein
MQFHANLSRGPLVRYNFAAQSVGSGTLSPNGTFAQIYHNIPGMT